jgi:hypothetical protein
MIGYVCFMSITKLKIRTGPHEFEAEGDGETVMEQFRMFREMIAADAAPAAAVTPAAQPSQAAAPLPLNRLFRVGARIVALSVSAKPDDAVLMLILGQKHFLKNENVSGAEIMEGLRQSAIRLPRADLILARHADQGIIVMTGRRRMRRYRLSAAGLERAQHIARTLISQIPPAASRPSAPDA